MTDFGLKVSLPGNDVSTSNLQDLVIDTNYPFPKCDLRIKPKNYGIINFTIATISGSTPVIVYQQPHSYGYIPEFLDAWFYPAGTEPLAAVNTTFGIGDIDATLSNGLYVAVYVDNVNFYVSVKNLSGTPVTNSVFSIRFYIFADDFSGT